MVIVKFILNWKIVVFISITRKFSDWCKWWGYKLEFAVNLEIFFLQREIGKKAENLIQRQFEGSRPYGKVLYGCNQSLQFQQTSMESLYLSPILDGYNSEIIAFTLSRSPDLNQVRTMLAKAFPAETYKGTILP